VVWQVAVIYRQLLSFANLAQSLQDHVAFVLQLVVEAIEHAVWLLTVIHKVEQGQDHEHSTSVAHVLVCLVVEHEVAAAHDAVGPVVLVEVNALTELRVIVFAQPFRIFDVRRVLTVYQLLVVPVVLLDNAFPLLA
jgi:hypothetical protein